MFKISYFLLEVLIEISARKLGGFLDSQVRKGAGLPAGTQLEFG